MITMLDNQEAGSRRWIGLIIHVYLSLEGSVQGRYDYSLPHVGHLLTELHYVWELTNTPK